MRLWVAAAEASGDALGAELVAALRARGPVVAAGLAGPAMRAGGVQPAARAEDATALGVAEVIRQVPRLARLLSHLNRAAAAFAPDVAVTIDSPGLLLRHGRALRRQGIGVAHWVAPQVWAWRPGRARRIGACADSVLCLLPFEPPLFHAHGVRAVFTGHPAAARARPAGSRTGAVVLAPGSRASEVARLAPLVGEVCRRLRRQRPDVELRVAVAPTVPSSALAGLPGRRFDGVAEAAVGASAAVVASGTATVELAAAGVPMVVVYAVHPVTYGIGRALVRGVEHLALPNIVAKRAIVPEHVQHLDADAITDDLVALWGPAGDRQRDALRGVVARLGGEGAVTRAADEVVRLAGRSGW